LQQLVALLSDLQAKGVDLHQQGIDTTTAAGKSTFQTCVLSAESVTTVREAMTTTITFSFDASAFGALRLAPMEFAREMRIAAAVQWYAQGIVSQGKAAELADLTRAEFLEELHRRKVPACQVTADELADEIHGA
jgi:predicted HTH domain antitoxin